MGRIYELTPRKVNTLVDKDWFAQDCGIRIVETTDHYSCTEMTVESRHLNGAGVCQGGALFTMADLAMASVVNRNYTSPTDDGVGLSVNTQITFLHPAALGDRLLAECKLIKDGRLPLLETRISNQQGQLIASLTGQFYRSKR